MDDSFPILDDNDRRLVTRLLDPGYMSMLFGLGYSSDYAEGDYMFRRLSSTNCRVRAVLPIFIVGMILGNIVANAQISSRSLKDQIFRLRRQKGRPMLNRPANDPTGVNPNIGPAYGESIRSELMVGAAESSLFLPAVTYGSGGFGPDSAVVMDFNADGQSDLAVANGCAGFMADGSCTGGSVGILLGKGDGTFQPAVSYATRGFFSFDIATGDVNGDGKPDLVVMNTCDAASCENNSSTVSVLLGKGDGTFGAAVVSGVGHFIALSLALSDLNADGKLDVVVAGCNTACFLGSGRLGVLLGKGDGLFKSAVLYNTGGQDAESVVVADENGDGKPDLVVANCATANVDYACPGFGVVGILFGRGDGSFKNPIIYSSSVYATRAATVSDVNGDGHPDLFVAAECGFGVCDNGGEGGISVLLGNTDGKLQSPVIYGSAGCDANSVTLADLNRDDKLDLVVSNGASECGASQGSVGVLLGNGDGTFQVAKTYKAGVQSSFIIAADVNGDNKIDAITVGACVSSGSCANGVVGVLLNNSPPHSATTTVVNSSLNPAPFYKSVTYTATVTSGYTGPVTGTVTFKDGSTLLNVVPLTNNQATYSASYNKIASHAITATYSGDADSAGNISAPLIQYIAAPTQIALVTSGSPSFVNQPVRFTATVTSKFGTVPDGSRVVFYDGTIRLASLAIIGGSATYTTSSLSVRTHFIRATYLGTNTFAPSAKNISQIVQP